jgi:glutamate--cysteine ligase
MKNRIHNKLLSECEALVQWYESKLTNNYIPFYSSFDIRDAGFKIGNVDGNIYPAGFNNICQMDKEGAPEVMSHFFKKQYPKVSKILLLTEDHLKNTFYWENIITIKDLLLEAGFQLDVGMLSEQLDKQVELESFSGKKIKVNKIYSDSGQLRTADFIPDLVITNNDFSNAYENVDFSQTQITPLKELGWYNRKKNHYFENYNKLVVEFAEIINEDPWFFQVPTNRFPHFDVTSEQSRHDLAVEVDKMISYVSEKYKQHEINEKPYVFVKNSSGTYGLGVVEAHSGADVESWNYKSKKKMKATKGGGGITEVIIQEGVPSVLTTDNATAEPVLYMIGSELVGGFLRTHEQKDSYQSLNSPGAVYKRLCLSDLKVRAEGCLLENVYGWVAKLGFLAISQEASQLHKTT